MNGLVPSRRCLARAHRRRHAPGRSLARTAPAARLVIRRPAGGRALVPERLPGPRTGSAGSAGRYCRASTSATAPRPPPREGTHAWLDSSAPTASVVWRTDITAELALDLSVAAAHVLGEVGRLRRPPARRRRRPRPPGLRRVPRGRGRGGPRLGGRRRAATLGRAADTGHRLPRRGRWTPTSA